MIIDIVHGILIILSPSAILIHFHQEITQILLMTAWQACNDSEDHLHTQTHLSIIIHMLYFLQHELSDYVCLCYIYTHAFHLFLGLRFDVFRCCV